MQANRIRGFVFAALAALTLTATSSFAALVTSFSDIQFWVGSGSNQAALVIDWNDGTTSDSYVWGFRWNDTATGEDMFRAIAGAIAEADNPNIPGPAVSTGSGDAALSLFILNFNFGTPSDPDWTPSVDRVAYTLDGVTHDQDSEGFNNGYWSYWVATSTNLPADWTSPMDFGFSDHILVNNAWEGWSFSADFNAVAPGQPLAAPIPEPATIALLLAGGAFALARRRRSHA